jgi:hypothetical protein
MKMHREPSSLEPFYRSLGKLYILSGIIWITHEKSHPTGLFPTESLPSGGPVTWLIDIEINAVWNHEVPFLKASGENRLHGHRFSDCRICEVPNSAERGRF